MGAPSAAVAMYTFLELSRRRLLALFLVLEALLVAGIAIAPLVLDSAPTAEQRAVSTLSTLSGVAGGGLLICAIGFGMTVVRNDLDSGAIVSILAKPVSRLAYTVGKLAAAAVLLVAVDGLFAIATAGVLELDGGGHIAVIPGYFAVLAANAAIWMVLVMALTVYLHNVLAAVVGIAILFLQALFGELHTLIEAHLVTAGRWVVPSEAVYWLLPRPLASNLERKVLEASVRLHPGSRPPLPLSAIPGASSPGDVLVWLVYLALVCGLLYLALRQKQV